MIFIWYIEVFLVQHVFVPKKFGNLLIIFIQLILMFLFLEINNLNYNIVGLSFKLIPSSIKFYFLSSFLRFSCIESYNFDIFVHLGIFILPGLILCMMWSFSLTHTNIWSVPHATLCMAELTPLRFAHVWTLVYTSNRLNFLLLKNSIVDDKFKFRAELNKAKPITIHLT